MRKIIVFILAGIILTFMTCESTTDDIGATGTLSIKTFDAPFQGDVEHIYLNIIQVSVHKSNADTSDTTSGWIILSEIDTTVDFLELVNGQVAQLIEENLEIGQYSQLRLLLGDSSSIVINGIQHELGVPSGSQSGVKLNLGFTIETDQIAEIYLDFDAARSIHKHPYLERYSMKPVFKVFRSVLSATLAGTISDTLGAGLDDIVVHAVMAGDTTSTLSSDTGQYKFILLEGTYNVSAEGFELTADTSYQDVLVTAGNSLADYNFILN
ncbi:MAG: DUF4382 domain-containing protein [Candidatus Marinimicrobia bacterium]|nr:DUF4382 domain-containing protein [Candidatus Neomarinimicrobiota bacterium]MCF7850371.1 DUF4382 domain-containing protein [Candidatus Neomarinimicrobiota bacterium]MCF7904496.1 DUF4382 domain-containing protein [Candidatus Neomarinimicrobiota bacterium]